MGGPTRKVGGAATPHYAVIAQLAERLPCKQQVEGSSPSGGSKADDPVKIQLGRKVEFPAGIPARLFTMRTMRGFFIGLWPNGKAWDFDSQIAGPTPASPTNG